VSGYINWVKTFFSLAFFCFCASDIYAQKYTKIYKRKRVKRVFEYSCPVVKKFEALQGVGIKVGDPIGLTYKIYFRQRFAAEVVGGSTTSGLFSDFIIESFEVDPEYQDFTYIGHENEISPTVQARLLIHSPLPAGITGETGIDWFIGIGYMVRFLRVNYTFESGDNPVDFMIGNIEETFMLSGPEGILGFEYVLSTIPVTVFVEGGIFIDVQEEISEPRFQGGLGLRYNF